MWTGGIHLSTVRILFTYCPLLTYTDEVLWYVPFRKRSWWSVCSYSGGQEAIARAYRRHMWTYHEQSFISRGRFCTAITVFRWVYAELVVNPISVGMHMILTLIYFRQTLVYSCLYGNEPFWSTVVAILCYLPKIIFWLSRHFVCKKFLLFTINRYVFRRLYQSHPQAKPL